MVAHAQTTSTSTATAFEAPPKCDVVGTSREEVWTTQQVQAGPSCIGVGDRDVANPSPACGGFTAGDPDPGFGTTFLVPEGTENVNKHTHTLTVTCVPPTPALPAPWLTGLGLGVLGAGAAMLRRLRGSGAALTPPAHG